MRYATPLLFAICHGAIMMLRCCFCRLRAYRCSIFDRLLLRFRHDAADADDATPAAYCCYAATTARRLFAAFQRHHYAI